MKKVAVFVVLLFLVSLFFTGKVLAQEERIAHIKAQIKRHRSAIRRLVEELKALGELPPTEETEETYEAGEGEYTDTGYTEAEGVAPLPPPPTVEPTPIGPPPGKLPPGKLPPGKLPPGKLPPGKLPPGKLPPGKLPPKAKALYKKGLPPKGPVPGAIRGRGPGVKPAPGKGRGLRRGARKRPGRGPGVRPAPGRGRQKGIGKPGKKGPMEPKATGKKGAIRRGRVRRVGGRR